MFDELRARWRALLNPLQRDDVGWPLDSVDIERDVGEPEPVQPRAFR